MRNDFFAHLEAMPLEYFQRNRTGDLPPLPCAAHSPAFRFRQRRSTPVRLAPLLTVTAALLSLAAVALGVGDAITGLAFAFVLAALSPLVGYFLFSPLAERRP